MFPRAFRQSPFKVVVRQTKQDILIANQRSGAAAGSRSRVRPQRGLGNDACHFAISAAALRLLTESAEESRVIADPG